MNFEHLISPISEASPTGSDCGYTAEFQQLTAVADYLMARSEVAELDRQTKIDFQGENADSDLRSAKSNLDDGRRKSERLALAVKELTGRQPSLEGSVKELRSRAEHLLTDVGKDIRVVQHLTLAWMGDSGIEGLSAGFSLISALLDLYGNSVYPQPDEDDPEDVSARTMALSEMLSGSGFVNALRDCVVLASSGIGRLGGRDVEVIDRVLDDDHSDGARSSQHIRAIAQGMALADPALSGDADLLLQRSIDEIVACLAAIDNVVSRFVVGTLHGDRVVKLLQRIKYQLESAKTPDSQSELGADGAGQGNPSDRQATALSEKKNRGIGGVLETRYDAQKMILEICRFIEETEPGHPAPLFLRRAERLLGAKDFFAIMRDMVPDAISELERITGHRNDVADQ